MTEGLTIDQSDEEFDEKLKQNIDEIYTASLT
jgi:fructose-bisphosphate aldolase, class I